MTSTAASYQGSLTAAAAREHVSDLLREASMARAASLSRPARATALRGSGRRGGRASRRASRRARCAPRSPRDRRPTHETEGSDRP